MSKVKSDTIVAYANSATPDMIPLPFYLVNILGWSVEQSDALVKELEAWQNTHASQAAADAKALAAAQAKQSVQGDRGSPVQGK